MPKSYSLNMQSGIKNILSSILLGALFILCPLINGQTPKKQNNQKNEDSYIAIDSDIAIDTAKRVRKHSPKLAVISSMVIPGMGQAYNRKYWKIPLIWGAGIALYTYYDFNNNYYHRFKLADEQLSAGVPITDPELKNMTENAIEINKNFYRSHRDKAIIYSGLVYIANIIDAMVDAHLLDYDISEDLSLHWEPTTIPANLYYTSTATIGVKFQLKF